MPAKQPVHIMPALAESDVGPSVIEEIPCGPRTIKLARPATPEQILDLAAVADAYDKDEYMPYWAALWPVATALSRLLLETPWPKGWRAIELGCGLGLPGVAALLAGLDVTFTDYDETALRFAEGNARLNGVQTGFRSLALDWRAPLPETFEVIIASDLIYEERNVEPLVQLFNAMLAPGGVVLAADQNRAHAPLFLRTLVANDFACETIPVPAIANPGNGASPSGTLYRITKTPPATPR